MAISDDVKRRALETLEEAHGEKARRLGERLRICGLSFKCWRVFWEMVKAKPLVSIADAEKFDAEAVKVLVDGFDAKIAAWYGVAPDQIVVFQVFSSDSSIYICASIVLGGEEIPLLAFADVGGNLRKVAPLDTPGRTWKMDADGDVRLVSRDRQKLVGNGG
jgi:hypothetical protein